MTLQKDRLCTIHVVVPQTHYESTVSAPSYHPTRYSLLVTGLPGKLLLWGWECVYKGPWYACSTRNREPRLPTGPRGITSRPSQSSTLFQKYHQSFPTASCYHWSPKSTISVGIPDQDTSEAQLVPNGRALKHPESKVGEGCLFPLHSLEGTACYSNTIYSEVVLKMDYLSFWTLLSLDSATLKSHVLGHAVNIYTLLRHHHVL